MGPAENEDWGGWLRPDWDRFGSGDVRGALNYITPERIIAAASLVRKGEVIPLNRPLTEAAWSDARPPLRRTTLAVNRLASRGDGYFGVMNDDMVEFALQGSSHLDSFAHSGLIEPGEEAVFYGGRGLEEVGPRGTPKQLGIEAYGGAIVTRGVLLDTVAAVGASAGYLPDDFEVTEKVVRWCLDHQCVELRSGDAVLIYTGYEKHRGELGGAYPDASPGTDGSTTRLWRSFEISLLASDNVAVETARLRSEDAEAMPSRRRRQLGNAHVGALRNLGIPLGELWALEPLAQSCREDGVYDFLLVSVPLNIPGAFGSPANAVALR